MPPDGSGGRRSQPEAPAEMRNPMARPRFAPTKEQRAKVHAMAAMGIPHEEIAGCIGIRSAKTLRRHFRGELDHAAPEANARVAQCLFQLATTGKNVMAAIFWAKTRMGWRETSSPGLRPAESPPFLVMVEKEPPCK